MQKQGRDPLIEEALHWLVVLNDRDATEADRAAFDGWLQADPDHRAAWARAQDVWQRVDKVRPAFATGEVAAPSPLPVAVSPLRRPAATKPPGLPGRRRVLYAAVAAPAVVLLMRPDLFADHATAIGERRKIALEDGSIVELAGASSLSIDFSDTARRVVLHGGEAFFDVAGDGVRPFIVQAADGQARALGTSFDVKRQDSEVTVAVTRHEVAVSSAGRRVVVRQGEQVRYGSRGPGTLREADLAQVQAWRRDRLVFHETALGEVVADLERYRGGRIVITDARLRDIPVTAVFDARYADAALDTIASSLSLRLRRVTGLLVVLSPAA